MERFVGKVAIVTGSASGIGLAITKKLVECGIIVAGLDVAEEKLKEIDAELLKDGYSGKFVWKVCDIRKENEIDRTFQWVNRNVGKICVLINSAGVLPRTTLLGADEEKISQTLDTNVKGLLLCNKTAANLMMENSVSGHIININSINGHYIRNSQNANVSELMIYAASKHAVTVLTEGLRRELIKRQSNIKVSSISPGGVKTALTDTKMTGFPEPLETEALQPKSIANACLKVLDTEPNELISELTVMAIHQQI